MLLFQIPDSIPLILYANGIVMFAGPFRSFDEPITRRCLSDIMDGFFPSELQGRFPDGVPFQVCMYTRCYGTAQNMVSCIVNW